MLKRRDAKVDPEEQIFLRLVQAETVVEKQEKTVNFESLMENFTFHQFFCDNFQSEPS